MRIVTDFKHAQQIIVELDAEIERLTARLIAESGEVEDLVNRLQESEDDNGRLLHLLLTMKRIAKLEADATCWTHGMNKEGTTGGMYLKANCPDCKALEGEGK